MTKRTLIITVVLALVVSGFGVLTVGATNQAPAPTARYQDDATPWLGVGIEDADNGAVITQVIPGSPADEAGLSTGDVITAVDETEIDSAQTLIDTIQSYAPGDVVTLTVERDGESLDVTVTLGERPEVITTERIPSDTRPMVRGTLNVLGLEARMTDEGLEISEIADDSLLAGSGLQVGDVITALNDQPVTEMDVTTLMHLLHYTTGEPISVTLLRDGEEMTIDVTIELPTPPVMPDFGAEMMVPAQPSQLGVRFQTLTPDIAESDELPVEEGARILEIYDDTPAAEAGLQVDDIITEVDGDVVDEERTLSDRLYAYEEGDTVTLMIVRDGEEMTLDVTLGPRAVQFGPMHFEHMMPMRPGNGPGMYFYYEGDALPRFHDMMPDMERFFETHPNLEKFFQGLDGDRDWHFDFDFTPDKDAEPVVPDTPA